MCGGTGKEKGFKPNWDKFFAECINDQPNRPVINTMLRLVKAGCEVWIWSGRMSTVRPRTIDWLAFYTDTSRQVINLILNMRPAGDYRPDEVLKKQWLDEMTEDDRSRLVAVFDDRQKVVDMWRKEGVACFQVAPGDF